MSQKRCKAPQEAPESHVWKSAGQFSFHYVPRSLGPTFNPELEEGELPQDVQNSDGGENRKAEQGLGTLAILYVRFEQVSKDLGEADHKFDKEFEELRAPLDGQTQALRLVYIASQAVHASRVDYHRLSWDYEVAEIDMNEGLGCIRALVGKTAAATSVLSVETKKNGSIFRMHCV